MNSNDISYYNGLGIQNFNNRQYKEAILFFSKAIELAPNNPDYYHNRAECYRLSEQYEKAIPDYSFVLESNSRDAKVFYKRGICYNRADSPQKALNDFNNAISLNPSIDVDCYMCRVLSHCSLGDKSGAIKDLEYVLRLHPNHSVAREMLAQVKRL
jgi:tetratricopeptide (TPR) repeat protein